MKLRLISLALVLAAAAGLGAQDFGTAAMAGSGLDAQNMERLQLALSTLEYPVTPGDVYRLSYRQSTTSDSPIVRDIQVSGDYSVDLGVFGKLDGSDLTFIELKSKVEDTISKSYSRSQPMLSISSTGEFRVRITGELPQTLSENAWGLTRLSEVVLPARGPYSGIRDVEVLSRSGSSRHYDLQKALRLGQAAQDPYLRPGDSIVLRPAGRTVALEGQVRQPGRYELLPAEGLRELVESFGGGYAYSAEPSRVRIDSLAEGANLSTYVALPEAYAAKTALYDGDRVTVPSRVDRLHLFWLEGAVSQPAGAGIDSAASTARAAEAGGVYQGFAVSIHEGQYLSDVLGSFRSSILGNADLQSARLIRQGQAEAIRVDLVPLLTRSKPEGDIMLKADDRLFIPIRLTTVFITGAVISPGALPYIAGSKAKDYIALAGGADPMRNDWGSFSVTGANGKWKPSGKPIEAGDRIHVLENDFFVGLERILPLIEVSAAIIVSGYAVYDLINR